MSTGLIFTKWKSWLLVLIGLFLGSVAGVLVTAIVVKRQMETAEAAGLGKTIIVLEKLRANAIPAAIHILEHEAAGRVMFLSDYARGDSTQTSNRYDGALEKASAYFSQFPPTQHEAAVLSEAREVLKHMEGRRQRR